MPFLSTPSFDLSAGAEPTLGPRPAPVPPSPPAPASAAHPQVSEAAARRLREAEERLREAIEELHRHQGGGGEGKEGEEHHGDWGCGHDGESCAAHAAGNLCQSFLLSYGVRVGIGILLRAFKLARRKSYGSLLDLKVSSLFPRTAKHLYCSVLETLNPLQPEIRIDGIDVMYAFVMRPESLPKSYQDFILKTGPVAEPVYKAVRECCRGGPLDLTGLSAYLATKKNSNLINLTNNPSIIPCSVIHPDRTSCMAHNINVISSTFKKTFPLYFSLSFVPFVVLRLQKVALFCMCMGGIMYFLEYEPDTMAPFLRGLIKRFLASKISNPSPPPNRNASYLQTLNALEQSRPQSGPENGTVTSEKYNLESIPGL
ncbi:hypothetical protein PR202_ga31612 [Eleusine coracana subsp. coracana]|uniref:Uncharacterized protein n=1 Tax=Eleusine coracana subsp. coracana TaxID=191504 RepID=A0AAV5DST8_ELECO|nr:hypothetical protein PR202_ga31612 [Eleusine coracana subsp. coracana]